MRSILFSLLIQQFEYQNIEGCDVGTRKKERRLKLLSFVLDVNFKILCLMDLIRHMLNFISKSKIFNFFIKKGNILNANAIKATNYYY